MAYIRIGSTVYSGLRRNDFKLATSSGDGAVTQQLEIVASTGSQARSEMEAVERVFSWARERWKDTLDGKPRNPYNKPVYFEIDLNEDGNWWRAEIMDGRAGADGEPLGYYTANGHVRYPITIQHENGWEGALTALTLTNPGGSNTAITCNFTNNYFYIPANQIQGNLPARSSLEIQNTYNNGNGAETVWAGLVRAEPGASTPWAGRYEGEAAVAVSSGSDASCVGGAYGTRTWTSTSPTQIFQWAIPGADIDLLKRRRIRPMLRFRTALNYTDLDLRFSVAYSVTELASTPWVRAPQQVGVHESYSLPLPPKYVDTGSDSYYINLWGRRLSGASTTVQIDSLYLLGAEQFMRLKPAGYNLPYGYTVVADGLNGLVYVTNGASRSAHYDLHGDFFTLMPNTLHSINVLHKSELSGATAFDRTLQCRMYYRPRRATL